MTANQAGDRVLTRQLTDVTRLPADIIQLILNLVREFNHRLLGYPRLYARRNDLEYVRRDALPKFLQLFRISLFSKQPQFWRSDWRRLERRVSDPTSSFMEDDPVDNYPLLRRIFTPIFFSTTEENDGPRTRYFGPGF